MHINLSEMLSILDGLYLLPGSLDRRRICDASIAIRAFGGGLFSLQEVASVTSAALQVGVEATPTGLRIKRSEAVKFAEVMSVGLCDEVYYA